jgi:hypothetical protein
MVLRIICQWNRTGIFFRKHQRFCTKYRISATGRREFKSVGGGFPWLKERGISDAETLFLDSLTFPGRFSSFVLIGNSLNYRAKVEREDGVSRWPRIQTQEDHRNDIAGTAGTP